MFGQVNHAAFVESWEKDASHGLPSTALLELYSRALGAIWERALVTLGETTLVAIADRVMYGCRVKFPWLHAVTLKASTGLSLVGLPVARLRDAELRQGLRGILVDLVNLIGALTADALTPQLHSELRKVGPAPTAVSTDSADAKDPKERSTVL